MTKVKICGITNLEDGINALNLGADYLGFNFYKNSPRFIEKSKAKKIIEKLSQKPKHSENVAVFVNENPGKIIDITNSCGIGLIQLSGDEDENFILNLKKATNKKIIKAFRVRKNFPHTGKIFSGADYILLDSFKKGVYGGTGNPFNWSIAKRIDKKILFLSGGINAGNVRQAVYEASPFCVDVCSGVEKSPGRKDFSMMKDFINSVKNLNSKRVEIF